MSGPNAAAPAVVPARTLDANDDASALTASSGFRSYRPPSHSFASLVTLRLFALAALVAAPAFAQPAAGWHLADTAAGIDLGRAYQLLEGRAPARDVVVAVIDSGVDLTHPDLVPVLWTNADETPGNGVDDDGNGYVDDVHGWSFLAGPGGTVVHERLELARLVASCRAGAAPAALDCPSLETELTDERRDLAAQAAQMGPIFQQVRAADELLRARFGATYDPADVSALDTGSDAEATRAKQLVDYVAAQGAKPSDLVEYEEYLTTRLQYHLNPDFDPRGMVGDDPADVSERLYGTADAAGPDSDHGTGVAGLIAAVRGNGAGIDGVALNTGERVSVRIMALRAVPDGDERDKDVANAIRYAVDNGAHIINMSFGKGQSPDKSAVDAAVAYATERGVLLVHAAGNDGADLDAPDASNYPHPRYTDGGQSALWLEIGASSYAVETLAASFSNYGATRVDLFAPGDDVTSLEMGGGTQVAGGTSFAAPVVSGVAALLMSYFPDLTAADVRAILLETSTRFPEATVPVPGGEDAVPFSSLSVTGGVVDAAAAVEAAMGRR